MKADYAITAEDGGWRILDSVSGRDGSTFVTSIEVVRYSNNATDTLTYPSGSPAPALVAGKFDRPLVLPGDLDHDHLVPPDLGVFKTGADDGPLVLPAADESRVMLWSLFEAKHDSLVMEDADGAFMRPMDDTVLGHQNDPWG